MTRRTTPTDADLIDDAADLEHLVQDKRAGWRADGARARRRQRRYRNLLTRHVLTRESTTCDPSSLWPDAAGQGPLAVTDEGAP
jgi:hypothetical protein